jgi:hypothetical protein
VSLERGSHLAPLGLEHAGEHQDRKSQQGKGRYDCKHRRFSFRFALNSSGTASFRNGSAYPSTRTMFCKCSADVNHICSFYVPLAAGQAEVLEIPPIIR